MIYKSQCDHASLDGVRFDCKVEGFTSLFSSVRGRVYSYIFSLVKSRDVADDILQETFIRVLSSLREGQYNERGKFLSWVLSIAHNQTFDYFRHSAQSVKMGISLEPMESAIHHECSCPDANIEERVIQSQICNDVRRLVDKLPLEQRDIVVMHHYCGMSFKEISSELGISINTALGRMRYALINIRKMVKENQISLAA
ncbi:MAG: RNA polymerase sigma factor [Bacteroidales bacterium]